MLGCESARPPEVEPAAAPEAPAPAPISTPQVAVPEPLPALPRAGELFYLERILGEAEPEATLPMIVAIHGLGDDPENFAHLFDAFTEPVRLIAPQGISPTEAGGWSWFPLRARDPDVDALSEGISSAAQALAESIEILTKARPTRGKPIVTGFSQGGMLTMTLAIHHPQVVGSAVAIGGWLPPPLWPGADRSPAGGPRLLALHGTSDNAVAYLPTQQAIAKLKAFGYDAELRSYEGVRHVISPEIQRDLVDALVAAVHVTASNGDPPP